MSLSCEQLHFSENGEVAPCWCTHILVYTQPYIVVVNQRDPRGSNKMFQLEPRIVLSIVRFLELITILGKDTCVYGMLNVDQ